MKLLCVFLILCASNAVHFVSPAKNVEDPIAKDNNAALWQVLYNKLNTLLNATDILSQSVADLQQRQDDEVDRILNSTKKYLDDNVKAVQKRLDKQDELIRNAFNNSQKWTTIQRRQDGSVDFYRTWNEYRKGFGNPDGEFFIGLDQLHILTTYGAPQELLIVLTDWTGESRYAQYDLFRIGSDEERYAIKELGEYSGNAGDSLSYHKLMKFTTKDNDNDHMVLSNCAVDYQGAGWFKSCFHSHLNGPYRSANESNSYGITWTQWQDQHSLKFAEMLIRSKL